MRWGGGGWGSFCRICLSGRILPWPAVVGSWLGAVPHKFTDTAHRHRHTHTHTPAGREHSQSLCQSIEFLEPVILLLYVQGARVSRLTAACKVPSWHRA